MNLANSIEVVAIWKKRKIIYYTDAMIYRKSYGPAPVTFMKDLYEKDEECDMLFHNFLMRRKSLYSSLRRSPEQFIQDGERDIIMYKELIRCVENGQII
jgi:hypothetical protein